MKRTVITNTSRIPTGTIREILRFVRPRGVSGIQLVVKPVCFKHITAQTWEDGRVVLRIPKERDEYPAQFERRAPYVFDGVVSNEEEDLVVYLAHEMQHVQQYKTVGRASERDADDYAEVMLRKWRQARREGLI